MSVLNVKFQRGITDTLALLTCAALSKQSIRIMLGSELNASGQTGLTDEDAARGSHTSCRVPTCFFVTSLSVGCLNEV